MDIQRLISMANQIGDFYESYPDQNQAQQYQQPQYAQQYGLSSDTISEISEQIVSDSFYSIFP